MPAAPTEARLAEAAVRLFAWVRSTYGTRVKDVLAWQDGRTSCFALYGSSPKLEAILQGSANNHDYWLNVTINKAFGIESEIERWPNSHRVRGVSPTFFSSDGSASFPEVVEGVESALREFFGDEAMLLRFTVIPEPGLPYIGAPTQYYSAARKRHFLVPGSPVGAVSVTYRDTREDKEITRHGANFCAVAPTLPVADSGSGGSGYGLMEATKDDLPILVAHSLELSQSTMATATLIQQCGGMLFPSLSVGSLPATNFGALVLVADPMIVLDSLKPYRKRGGVWPVAVYSTDTWTMRTSDFFGHASALLYDQLTGRWEIDYYSVMHLWTLGPAIEHAGGPTAGRQLDSIGQLITATRKRMKPWMKITTVAQLKKFQDLTSQTEGWYGYLEAKVHAVMPMSRFVAAFAPSWMLKESKQWLRATGFSGTLYPLETVPEIEKAYDPTSRMDSDHQTFWKIVWAKQVGAVAPTVLRKVLVSG